MPSILCGPGRSVVALTLSLTASLPVLATPNLHPNLARGGRAAAQVDADEFTAVDLFHGNLFLSISLGQSYRLDSQLSWALGLRYNSQIWDWSTVSGAAQAAPMGNSNAGLGFDLSFGRLLAPGSAANPSTQWMYVSPDGGLHAFYSSLHHDTPDVGDAGDATQYTRDSTYLRLRLLADGTRRVEHGDGVVRTFALEDGEWRLKRIASQAGGSVDVGYPRDGLSWTLTDSFGRVAVVRFVQSAGPGGLTQKLVDRVELPAFGGAVASYTFAYSWAAVGRACADSRGGTETVPLLESVTDPVGQVRSFEYFQGGVSCHDAGRLMRYRIASGGLYAFDYGQYTFPAANCGASAPGHLIVGSGVVQKQKLQPDGTMVGSWTYTPQIDAAPASCGFDGRRTVVVTPLGDQHVYHFAVGTDAPSAGGPALYGLPIAPTRPHPSAPLFLSEEVYDCNASGAGCVLLRTRWARYAQDQLCTTTSGNCFDTNRRLERSQEIFEDDSLSDGSKRFRDLSLSAFDGLGTYRSRLTTSNFGQADSLSSFRHTNPEAGTYPPSGLSTGGAFVVPSLAQPWFLADYAFASVTDEAGASLRTDACFAPEGWLLRTRRRSAPAELRANDVVTVFSWQAGEVVEEAKMGGDLVPLSTSSVLCALPLPSERFAVQREYDHGALVREVTLDATGQPLAFDTLDRDIDANTGKVATERAASGLAVSYLYDLAGRPTWERPQEGAWTQYVYNLPTGASAWNAGPKTTRYDRPNGGGAPLRTRIFLHDTFDRRTGDWITMPGGVLSGTRTQYNALDLETAESTSYQPGTGAALYWTEYLDHDPFGRARIIRPPEGAAHDAVVSFRGVREEVRTIQVGRYFNPVSHLCSEHPATITRTYDGQGRLWREERHQPHPLPGRLDRTETLYGVGGEVRSRVSEQTVKTVTKGERSERVYDGLGFLRSASTSNLGDTVAGVIENGEYDARGLSHYERRTGDFLPALGLAVRTNYDALGRIETIADATNPGKLWKEFEYADENLSTLAGTDRRRGQLVRAVRHNYFEGAHHTVAEDYGYLGLGGRLSEKTMTVATVFSPSAELRMEKSYRTRVSFDQLGNVNRLDYPTCVTCSPGEPTIAGSTLPVYDQGYLTALGGERGGAPENWISQVTWSTSRQPLEILHANGARDRYELDPFRLPRPSEIKVILASLTESSGTIVYDSTGSTCGRGDRSFVAIPAELRPEPPSLSACQQATDIDPFGEWSGALRDAECVGAALPSYRIFDAFDRHVATLFRSSVRQLTVNGQPYWQPDPTKFARRWMLYGLDGDRLSEVEDHFTLGFQTRADTIFALDRIVGRVKKVPSSSQLLRAHKHLLGVRNTRPDGFQLNAEL